MYDMPMTKGLVAFLGLGGLICWIIGAGVFILCTVNPELPGAPEPWTAALLLLIGSISTVFAMLMSDEVF